MDKYSCHSRLDGDCRFKVGIMRNLVGPTTNLVRRQLKKPHTLLHTRSSLCGSSMSCLVKSVSRVEFCYLCCSDSVGCISHESAVG